MSSVAKLKQLRRFAVDYCEEVSAASLSVLHYLPKLEEVRLHHCDAVHGLESLASCETLKKLDLTSNEHLDFSVLASLSQLSKLETLVLSENPTLEDRHLQLLGQFAALKDIDVSDCAAITDDGIAHLGKRGWVALDLSNCTQVAGAGFSAFESSSLETLDLPGCAIDDEGMKGLGTLKNLKSLNLQGNSSINGEGLIVLGSFTQLESLTLSGLPVTNEHLGAINGVTTLKRLTLRECMKVSGAGLAGLTNSTALEFLDLHGCRRFDAIEDFEQIAKFTMLKELDISATRLRPESVVLLQKLAHLENLDVSDCNWVDDVAIGAESEIQTLRNLKIDGLARITDQSLRHLAKLPNLERLHVGRNRQITGVGFAAFPDSTVLRFLELHQLDKLSPEGLENVPRFSQLEELTIGSISLTNEHLNSMRGLPNLKKLKLSDLSQVDENIDRQFRASLPKLKD